MATTVVSPERLIWERTLTTLRTMAGEREFTRSAGEVVRSVSPKAILRWITTEGAEHNQNVGFVNIPKPAILVTCLGIKEAAEGGVNCAQDIVVTIVIQIVDDSTGATQSQGPYATYMDWINRIRHRILGSQTIFRQDFADPGVADPYGHWAKNRVPTDPQRLWRHSQQVAAFAFFVKVRQHRAGG